MENHTFHTFAFSSTIRIHVILIIFYLCIKKNTGDVCLILLIYTNKWACEVFLMFYCFGCSAFSSSKQYFQHNFSRQILWWLQKNGRVRVRPWTSCSLFFRFFSFWFSCLASKSPPAEKICDWRAALLYISISLVCC